jgi:hypothetical protein
MMESQNHYKDPTFKLSLPPVKAAIMPYSPEDVNDTGGWQHLAVQAQRINEMADELETAILEFKANAATIKNYPRQRYDKGSPKSICRYFALVIPCVQQKPDRTFIVTTRKVDLFRSEREAANLAQDLREKSERKRLASQRRRRHRRGLRAS